MRILKLLLLLPLALLFGCQHNVTPQVETVECTVPATTPGMLDHFSWQVYSVRVVPSRDTVVVTFLCARH